MSELTAKENIKTADAVKRITATAVMAALTTLMTAYIFHIPVGVNGGYVHLGDTMIYLAAAFLPLPYACAAGAIGGGLADLLTAPVWAPATIIIKMLICLPFSSKGTKLVTNLGKSLTTFTEAASIMGLSVVGALIASSVKMTTALNFKVGEVSLALQTDVLDRIMPSLLPVLLTALVYKLLGNKKWTATKLILLIIVIALVCSFFGILTV